MAKQPIKLILCVGMLVVIAAVLFRFVVLERPGTAKISSVSTLLDAINISELSAAEFKYRGIADVYANEQRTKVRCRICYSAIVKAGIDMQKVGFEMDNENKVYTATLPNIDLKVTIVDEQSIAVLPSNAEVGLDEMLKYSKEDVENEVRNSSELIATARENVKATIEGLLFPILKSQGYSLKWK